jgi:molybdopterin molybdotransferase
VSAARPAAGGGDPARMISFPEALSRLLSEVNPASVDSCRIEEAAGRVLRSAVVSDRALPPYDRVMMDGFALRSKDWEAGLRTYSIAGIAPAGRPALELPEGVGTCVEIMTGAPLAIGADCIVPVEEATAISANHVTFQDHAGVVAGRHIHRAGSDVEEGMVLLAPCRRLGGRELGVAASCGFAWLQVSALPRIAVIATGDELVEVAARPEPHQIRQSNAHALAATLTRAGFPPSQVMACGDDVAGEEPGLRAVLEAHEWVILTGAVSKGARDFVPEMLNRLGYRRLFHGVAQRPGKPAGCWVGKAGELVIALPGNPVSAITGLHAFVLPALAMAAGLDVASLPVHFDASENGLPDFSWHLPVKLVGGLRVIPAPTGNSGDFIGLLASDGFITLPPRSAGPAASSYPFTAWL